MKSYISQFLPLLYLCTPSLTANLPASNYLSLVAINKTLGINTTLFSPGLSSDPPSDLPSPYTFRPKLPPGFPEPTLELQIQGYTAADKDPQDLLVAFNKAVVEAEHDHDLADHINEEKLIYKSKGAVVVFHPRQGITTWEDWNEAAHGFYQFFLDRAVEQKDGFGFIFELIADGEFGSLGFGTVTGRSAQTAVA